MPRQAEDGREISTFVTVKALASLGDIAAASEMLDDVLPKLERRYAPTHYRLTEAARLRHDIDARV